MREYECQHAALRPGVKVVRFTISDLLFKPPLRVEMERTR